MNNPAVHILNATFVPLFLLIAGLFQILCGLLMWILNKFNVTSRIIYDMTYKFAISPVLLFLECANNINIVHTGSDLITNDKGVFICNHPSYMDPFVICYWLQAKGCLDTSTCFILWKGLKHTPVGVLSKQAGSVFVGYGPDEDKKALLGIANKFNEGRYDKIVIFPEGSTLLGYMRDKSNKYASRFGYRPLDFCMYPKVTGLHTIMNNIDSKDGIQFYDLTLGYEGTSIQRPSGFKRKLTDLKISDVKNTVHIHCIRYPYKQFINTISIDSNISEALLRTWLWKSFSDKNEGLKRLSVTNKLSCSTSIEYISHTNLYIRYVIASLGILWMIWIFKRKGPF
tara:strand:+ start:69 stop:1091 length:1023 start_codon:yes stop_codon:yes gene_type:complete